MWQQKSFIQTTNVGTLYLVPTPIGNLEDITFRALKILNEVDLIAAEDTRQTQKLCNHFKITTPTVSYHEHNKAASGEKLIQELRLGKSIAIVSDAGMPSISDPGYDIVLKALEEKISVVPLPGANAALTALIASGLPTNHFYYHGFVSRGKKDRKEELEQLKNIGETLVFYEAPHRLKETLKSMNDVFGNRRAVIARELTKKFEEFIRGTLDELIVWTETDQVRGEFCIMVEGASESDMSYDEREWWTTLTIKDHVEFYMNEKQVSSKDAIKMVAKDRSISKRDVYQTYHVE